MDAGGFFSLDTALYCIILGAQRVDTGVMEQAWWSLACLKLSRGRADAGRRLGAFSAQYST